MFAKKDFNILLEHRQWDYAIELIPGSEPKLWKVYPLSPVEQKELDFFLEKNLHTRRIRSSKSPIAVPVFFIKKKDGIRGHSEASQNTLNYSRGGILS